MDERLYDEAPSILNLIDKVNNRLSVVSESNKILREKTFEKISDEQRSIEKEFESDNSSIYLKNIIDILEEQKDQDFKGMEKSRKEINFLSNRIKEDTTLNKNEQQKLQEIIQESNSNTQVTEGRSSKILNFGEGLLKKSSVDITSIMAGVMGNSPLAMMASQWIGNSVTEKYEKYKETKSKRKELLKELDSEKTLSNDHDDTTDTSDNTTTDTSDNTTTDTSDNTTTDTFNSSNETTERFEKTTDKLSDTVEKIDGSIYFFEKIDGKFEKVLNNSTESTLTKISSNKDTDSIEKMKKMENRREGTDVGKKLDTIIKHLSNISKHSKGFGSKKGDSGGFLSSIGDFLIGPIIKKSLGLISGFSKKLGLKKVGESVDTFVKKSTDINNKERKNKLKENLRNADKNSTKTTKFQKVKSVGRKGLSIGKGLIGSAIGLFGAESAVSTIGDKLTTVKNTTSNTIDRAKTTSGKVLEKVSDTTKGIKETGTKGFEKVSSNVAEKASKTTIKSFVKKIPVIGAIAGIGFGIDRLLSGDTTGAIAEVASGTASIVPGIGTAASTAIDAGLITRDIMQQEHLEKQSKLTQIANDAENKHGWVDIGFGHGEIEDKERLIKEATADDIDALLEKSTWNLDDKYFLNDLLDKKRGISKISQPSISNTLSNLSQESSTYSLENGPILKQNAMHLSSLNDSISENQSNQNNNNNIVNAPSNVVNNSSSNTTISQLNSRNTERSLNMSDFKSNLSLW